MREDNSAILDRSNDRRQARRASQGTVAASAYDRIKQDIIFGRLEPGSKLKLNAMRLQYQASVSTIRETLGRLATEGFVLAAEQRGFFVTDVSADDLTEVANLRILLECSALRTSATGLAPSPAASGNAANCTGSATGTSPSSTAMVAGETAL